MTTCSLCLPRPGCDCCERDYRPESVPPPKSEPLPVAMLPPIGTVANVDAFALLASLPNGCR